MTMMPILPAVTGSGLAMLAMLSQARKTAEPAISAP